MTLKAPHEVAKDDSSPMRYVLAGVVVMIGIVVLAYIVFAGTNDDDDDVDANTTDNSSDVVAAEDESEGTNGASEESESDESGSESAGISGDLVGDEESPCQYDDEVCFVAWVNAEQGATEDGIPTIGSDDAPIIIAEFGDFSCPHCMAFAPTFEGIVHTYAPQGQAQFRFYPLTFVAGDRSVDAAEAALCTIEQGAFWQYHEVLYVIQETQSSAAFVDENLIKFADDMGLDGTALEACLATDRPAEILAHVEGLRNELGVSSTPTIVYSTDGGETWMMLEDRSDSNIRDLIESQG